MGKNILFLKPYRASKHNGDLVLQPPLGPLYLASAIRKHFPANDVVVSVHDARVRREEATDLLSLVAGFDIVGISAMQIEAEETLRIASLIKKHDSKKLVVAGGPWTYQNGKNILENYPDIDWVFEGESERSFPIALERYHSGGIKNLGDIPGLYYREENGAIKAPSGLDRIENLDLLPFPAWDLIDFENYRHNCSMNGVTSGKRYAPILTSRGCAFQCIYCHNLFGKEVRMRSVDNIVEEISLLASEYGIGEFQIVDDLFNYDKKRVHEFFRVINERYPDRRFSFCFPNGLRADLLDQELIELFRKSGVYLLTIAIETLSPRLQGLLHKNLNLKKVRDVIKWSHQAHLPVRGFFMLGIPTETTRELFSTIRFALFSKLTFAVFFGVVPHKRTPLHDLARKENEKALESMELSYQSNRTWYELSYGIPLCFIRPLAYVMFYMCFPLRVWRISRQFGWSFFFKNTKLLWQAMTAR